MLAACTPRTARSEEILQIAAFCPDDFPNPEVRHPLNQHRLSRPSLQQWILVVRLLWVSTLSSPCLDFFLNSM